MSYSMKALEDLEQSRKAAIRLLRNLRDIPYPYKEVKQGINEVLELLENGDDDQGTT